MRTSMLLVILAVGCCKTGDKCEPPTPHADGGFAYTVDSSDPCDLACDKLRILGCKEGKDTPGKVSCVDFCHHHQVEGPINLNPSCVVSKVNSCADVPLCAAD